MSFAHLHVHTEFSMLDGAARVKELVRAVVADGQPGVAITDHGVLYGVVDFYKAATGAGVKPIVGIEASDVEKHERPLAHRYLGEALGDAYIEQTGGADARADNIRVRMRPERWLTVDYRKEDVGL